MHFPGENNSLRDCNRPDLDQGFVINRALRPKHRSDFAD
jgi:hypothetical protein